MDIKRKTKMVIKLLLILIILLGSIYVILKINNISIFQKKTSITSTSLKEQLVGINEIATLEYTYSDVGSFSSDAEIFGAKIPFLTKKFILVYDGRIKAGINMDKAEVELKDKSIEIRLPPAQILSHEIFEDSVQIYDESSSIFNPLKLEDFTKFRVQQKEIVEERSKTHALLEEARLNAENIIRTFITALPGGREYRIKFLD